MEVRSAQQHNLAYPFSLILKHPAMPLLCNLTQKARRDPCGPQPGTNGNVTKGASRKQQKEKRDEDADLRRRKKRGKNAAMVMPPEASDTDALR
jgi:hypothetical protein